MVSFLMFDVSSKTFHCIVHWSGVISVLGVTKTSMSIILLNDLLDMMIIFCFKIFDALIYFILSISFP